MSRMYFRDFLSKFIAHGGDVSKITFRSINLVNKYKILRVGGGDLRCTRIMKDGRTETAFFAWPTNRNDGLYGGFTVVKLEENIVGTGLRKEIHLTLHLRGAGN